MKKLNKNHQVEKAKKFWCYRRRLNKTPLQFVGLCVPSNFRYLSKCFAEIYSLVWKRHVGVPARYTNMVAGKYCKHLELWLFRRLIISTEQTSIYISTFANALTCKKAENHEISIYFSTNSNTDLGHTPPYTVTLNFKMLWFPNKAPPWAVKL